MATATKNTVAARKTTSSICSSSSIERLCPRFTQTVDHSEVTTVRLGRWQTGAAPCGCRSNISNPSLFSTKMSTILSYFFLLALNDLAILSYAIRSHSWQAVAGPSDPSVLVGTRCDLTAMRSCLSAALREPTMCRRLFSHVSSTSLSIPGRVVVVRFVSRIH